RQTMIHRRVTCGRSPDAFNKRRSRAISIVELVTSQSTSQLFAASREANNRSRRLTERRIARIPSRIEFCGSQAVRRSRKTLCGGDSQLEERYAVVYVCSCDQEPHGKRAEMDGLVGTNCRKSDGDGIAAAYQRLSSSKP